MSKKKKPNSTNPAKASAPSEPIVLETVENEYPLELIFTINGKEYFIEKKPRLNVTLRFLDLQRKKGQGVAMSYLLAKSLGKKPYKAMLKYDELDSAILKRVFNRVQEIALGGIESPKGS